MLTRWSAGLAVASLVGLGVAVAGAEDATPSTGPSDDVTAGMEEMHRFCTSERMPEAMSAMMEMMGGMGQMGGMMGPGEEAPR